MDVYIHLSVYLRVLIQGYMWGLARDSLRDPSCFSPSRTTASIVAVVDHTCVLSLPNMNALCKRTSPNPEPTP